MDNRVVIMPPGMYFYALAFLLGTVFLQQSCSLPGFSVLLCLFAACLLLIALMRYIKYRIPSCLKRYITLTIIFIILINIGFVYSWCFARWQLNQRLPETGAGKDLQISGRVVSIPKRSAFVQRFEFEPDHNALLTGQRLTTNGRINKIRLSWYYGKLVNAGERWQLTVRLKPPHGFRNPGGFDYEGWLFQQGIDATGYVRKSGSNRRLQRAPWWSIDRWRQYLGETIDRSAGLNGNSRKNGDLDEKDAYAIIRALAIGDRSAMTARQWRVFSATGTSHLMAISGLHIGLAFLFAWLVIRFILPHKSMSRVPAQHAAMLAGLLLALLYALLAGMTIPTQRALIMLMVLSMMQLLRRNHRPQDALGLALLLVLLFDPLAVLSAGFWFSFSAVAVIFITLQTEAQARSERAFSHRMWRLLKHWLRLQLFISLCLLPLSLFMFQQASLVSPLANLVLIPYVSFLLVPLVLLAMLSSLLEPALADSLLAVAAWLLQQIWPWLQYLSTLPFAAWQRGDVRLWQMLLASAGLMILVLYPSISLKLGHYVNNHQRLSWLRRVTVAMAVLLLFPLGIRNVKPVQAGEYRLTVLDVGQGSAAVIETATHVLVFDTGARFGPRFDVGSAVILPFLRARGLEPDQLVISHGDSDHIGGAQAILTAFPDIELIGQDIDSLANDVKTPCYRGMQWHWDGVDFEFLSPDRQAGPARKRNNRSCVLRVSSAAGSVLLSGDIEKKVEKRLLELQPEQLKAEVLIAPHHGSNTSSSAAFITAVSPEVAIISVAYRNRYRLPSRHVLERFQQRNIDILQTWRSGAITITFEHDSISVPEKYRQQARKYWHRQFR